MSALTPLHLTTQAHPPEATQHARPIPADHTITAPADHHAAAVLVAEAMAEGAVAEAVATPVEAVEAAAVADNARIHQALISLTGKEI